MSRAVDRLAGLESFARERLVSIDTRAHRAIPFVRAACVAIIERVDRARAGLESGDAQLAATQSIEAVDLEYAIILSDDLEPTLAAGRSHSRAQAERRRGKYKVPESTRRRIVAYYDSAVRQGEPWLPLVRAVAPEISAPTIRSIIRAAGRTLPARARK